MPSPLPPAHSLSFQFFFLVLFIILLLSFLNILHFYTLYIFIPPFLFFCFRSLQSWIYLSSSLFFGFINITFFLFFFFSFLLLFLTSPMFVVIGFVLYLSNFSHPLRWVQQLHICNTYIHSKHRCGYVDELVLLMNDGYTWHDLFNNSGWYTEAQRRHSLQMHSCIQIWRTSRHTQEAARSYFLSETYDRDLSARHSLTYVIILDQEEADVAMAGRCGSQVGQDIEGSLMI